MRMPVLLALCLSLGLSSMTAAYTIGLYADPAGASCDLPAVVSASNTWYLVAKLSPGEDLTAFELEITGLPGTFLILSEVLPAGALGIGTSFFSGGGMAVALPSCESGSTALLATITVFPQEATVATLDVVAAGTPSLDCGGDPVVVDCDGSTLLCAAGTHAFVNQSGCDDSEIFSDGFESGDTTLWSSAVGVPGFGGFGSFARLDDRD